MNVFNGNFGAIRHALYVEANREGVLGTETGTEHAVRIIVTAAFTNAVTAEIVSQNSDVLVYAEAGSPLSQHKCVGGHLVFGGRTLRIESYAEVVNQRKNEVAHIELGCSEL